MEHALRRWVCGPCGRANETVVALDGQAVCAFCRARTRIQRSRDYLSLLSPFHPQLPGDEDELDENGLPRL